VRIFLVACTLAASPALLRRVTGAGTGTRGQGKGGAVQAWQRPPGLPLSASSCPGVPPPILWCARNGAAGVRVLRAFLRIEVPLKASRDELVMILLSIASATQGLPMMPRQLSMGCWVVTMVERVRTRSSTVSSGQCWATSSIGGRPQSSRTSSPCARARRASSSTSHRRVRRGSPPGACVPAGRGP